MVQNCHVNGTSLLNIYGSFSENTLREHLHVALINTLVASSPPGELNPSPNVFSITRMLSSEYSLWSSRVWMSTVDGALASLVFFHSQ